MMKGNEMYKQIAILQSNLRIITFMVVIHQSVGIGYAKELHDGIDGIEIDEVRTALSLGPHGVVSQLGPEQMRRYVENMLIEKRLEAEARKLSLHTDPIVQGRMEKASRDILVKAYIESVLAKYESELSNLEPLAREQYEIEKKEHIRPEAVRVAHILIRVKPEDESNTNEMRSKAERVLEEIKSGGDFTELAKAYSEDGAAARGGELAGWREKGTLVPAFERAAYALKPGEISGVVRTQFGYHIIKNIEHRPAKQKTYEEMRDGIVAKIKKELINKRRDELVNGFRGNRSIQIDEPTFEKLRRNN